MQQQEPREVTPGSTSHARELYYEYDISVDSDLVVRIQSTDRQRVILAAAKVQKLIGKGAIS